MKLFQYLTILMVAIVAIEAQLPGHMWTDEDWKRWEWISNADKPFEQEGTGDDHNDGWREDDEAEHDMVYMSAGSWSSGYQQQHT